MELSLINVSQKKEKQFNKKGIYSVEDLLRFLPKSYYDFRKEIPLTECLEGKPCALIALVEKVDIYKKCVAVRLRDCSSLEVFKCVWFGAGYIAQMVSEMYFKNVLVCGVPKYNEEYSIYEITNPILFTEQIEENKKIYPVYPKIEGMSSEYLQNSIEVALSVVDKTEKYSEAIRNHFQILEEWEMYQCVHRPTCAADIKKAQRRLIFEELYEFAVMLEKGNKNIISVSPYVIKTLETTNQLIRNLPYTLTEDQKKTLNSMVSYMKTGKRVNALLQGDVGTGKTIVAFILMFSMAENGYQSVLMAPTSVLAEQHYKELLEYANQYGFKVAFLAGKMRAAEKRALLSGIKDGTYQFIVGTHSVISKDVEFHKLGLSVVDEEHRFGVNQRQKLMLLEDVHSISMSATPIPRTLALTTYGKAVDVYTIKTKPAGRKEIKTGIYNNAKNIFQFMANQIKEGRQCYIVCALKQESDSPVESVEDLYKLATLYFEGTNVKVAKMTGGMKKEETTETLRAFSANETQVLIATTIVEVGVNVPNASTIIIWDADRFGLATLHQLRGRVGRGQYQSYCLLKSPNKTNPRLVAMCETTDGFEIATKDLEIRGSGDFLGTKQSGENKSVMLMLKEPEFYKEIEKYVEEEMEREVSLDL